jgi:hypothetical protein
MTKSRGQAQDGGAGLEIIEVEPVQGAAESLAVGKEGLRLCSDRGMFYCWR